MKKILAFATSMIWLAACNSGAESNTDAPTVIEDSSIQHPNGITNDGVISTDTAAFGVDAMNKDTTKKN